MLRTRSFMALSGALAALAVVVGMGGTASAHAELVSSSPPAESVLEAAPSEIVLTFSESVDTVPDSIRVVSGSGDDIAVGDVRRTDGTTTVAVDLPALADGSYVVAWRAVSADSHPINGAFTFSVGARTTTDANLVDELLAASAPSSSAERWLGLGRSTSYAGTTAAIGVVAVLAVLAPALIGRRRTRAVILVCLSIAAVGTLVMIAAQGSIAVGDPWAWNTVGRSSAGRWWFIRLGAIEVATALVLVRRWGSTQRWWSAVLAAAGLSLLVVVAAGGHAISGRWVTLGFVATVMHLAAMAVWFGGLVALTLVTPRPEIVGMARRFSPLALVSVVVLAGTGVVNAWRQAGSWDALTGSDYGTWLIVKLTVLGAVLTIAAVSRWLLGQSTGDDSTGDDSTGNGPTRAAIARTITAEVVGVILVFAATAGLVDSVPPLASALPTVASATTVVGDRLAQVTLDPPVTGGATMHVYLSSTTGSLDQPTDITVTATLASQGIGPLTIATTPAGPGHVSASDAILPIAGTWTIAVTARYSEFDQVTFTVDLPVR